MNTHVCIIWDNKTKIGYCHTWQEADEICKKYQQLTWSPAKYIPLNLNYVTINYGLEAYLV
jgi:hypothetical protein